MEQANKQTALATRQANPLAELARYQNEKYLVLTPVTQIESLPEGLQMGFTIINVDIDSGTYAVEGGKKAMTGQQLDVIANAAGVSWLESKRLDDRKHPHYCEFQVTGRVIDFDGTVRIVQGTRAVDLRDDAGGGIPGADLTAIKEAAKKGKEGPRDPAKQILGERQFIVPKCESKAKNRAIRHILAIKGAYRPEELRKPIVIPKVFPDSRIAEARSLILSNFAMACPALYPVPAQHVIDAEYNGNGHSPAAPSPGCAESAPANPTEGVTDKAQTDPPPPEPVGLTYEAIVNKAKKIGLKRADFVQLIDREVGNKKPADFTSSDLDLLDAALDAIGGDQW